MGERSWMVGLLIGAGVLLVGCAGTVQAGSGSGSTGDSSSTSLYPGGSVDSTIDLSDVVTGGFETTAITGRDLVAGSVITLTFEGPQLGIDAGCNGMGGTYRLQDDTLQVDQIYSTLMACAEPLMEQERWVADFLRASPQIAIDGDTMTLTGRGVVAEGMTLVKVIQASDLGT